MLLKNSAVVFAAMSFSTASAFLFQIMMGRSMPLGDFGQLSAYLSIQTMFSVPAGALILMYSRHAAMFDAMGKREELRGLYAGAWRVCLVVAAASGIAVFAGVLIWSGNADAPTLGAAAVLAALVAVYFVQAVPLAFVRGLQQFHLLAGGLGSAGGLKLILAGLLVYAGMISVPSAIGAIVAGVAVSVAVLHVMLRPAVASAMEMPSGLAGRQMFYFTMSAMAGTFFPMFYMNVDMILVRGLFSPAVSGHYGAFLVVGKVIFLCGQVIGMALFPAVVAGDVVDTGVGNRLVWRALFMLFAAGVVLVAAVALFPDETLGIILKERDEAMASLLPYYCAAILAVALLFLEWNYRLARHQHGFLWIAGAAAMVQGAGIAYFSSSLEGIVKFQAVLFGGLLAVRLALLFKEGRGGRGSDGR